MAELALDNLREIAPKAEFATATAAVTLKMRRALVDLVSALPGPITRPRHLEKATGVDYNLCWSVFQLLGANDVIANAHRVPKPPSIRRLLEAAERKGISADVLQAVRIASDEFESVVRQHAGNRITFESMLAGATKDSAAQIGLVERRNAFRVNTHIWGSQVDTFVMGFMVRANADPELFDFCALTARLGLKRLRAGAKVIALEYVTRGDPTNLIRPLYPEAPPGTNLVTKFCTQPLPEFMQYTAKGWIMNELRDETVGLSSSVDLAFGQVRENYAADRVPDGRRLNYVGVGFSTPAARLLLDFVVHRPSFGVVKPTLKVKRQPTGEQLSFDYLEERPREDLPVEAEVISVEGGIAEASTAEVPRHAEMLLHACDVLKWNPAEFDIYRVAMDYPILHSNVSMHFLC